MVARTAADFARPDLRRAQRVRDNLRGFDPETWRRIADQGWLAVLLPEDRGGTGLGVSAAAAISERLGYGCFTEPFVAVAVTAARCLLDCPEGDVRDSLLDAIGSGSKIATLAWQSPLGDLEFDKASVVAKADGGAVVLQGTARFVPVPDAEVFLVAARQRGNAALYSVPAGTGGLSVAREKAADGTFSGWLSLESVRVPTTAMLARGAQAEAALGAAFDAGVLCTAAELLGIVERSLELTLEYLRVRKQFGQRIGSFQVLQHRAVDMWIQKSLTRAALRAGLAVHADPGASAVDRKAAASSAKARASQAALYVAGQAVQLHGAIGTTDEYELGVYVNRSVTLAAQLGNAAAHRRRYGECVVVQER
jgi:alkylation response protein AidB-like acyl-CoA dehydrogenase